MPVYSTAREPCSLPRAGQGITAIPAPRGSEKIQTEEEGHRGGEQGPWLEVEGGGRRVAVLGPAGSLQLAQWDGLLSRSLFVITSLGADTGQLPV